MHKQDTRRRPGRKRTNASLVLAQLKKVPDAAALTEMVRALPVRRSVGDGACWSCGSPMQIVRGQGWTCVNPECGRVAFGRGDRDGATSGDG